MSDDLDAKGTLEPTRVGSFMWCPVTPPKLLTTRDGRWAVRFTSSKRNTILNLGPVGTARDVMLVMDCLAARRPLSVRPTCRSIGVKVAPRSLRCHLVHFSQHHPFRMPRFIASACSSKYIPSCRLYRHSWAGVLRGSRSSPFDAGRSWTTQLLVEDAVALGRELHDVVDVPPSFTGEPTVVQGSPSGFDKRRRG